MQYQQVAYDAYAAPQYAAVSSGLEGLPSYGALPPTVPALSAQYSTPQYSTPQYVSAGGTQALVDVPTVPMTSFGGAQYAQFGGAQYVQQPQDFVQYVQQPQEYVQYAQPQAVLAPQQSQLVVYEQPQSQLVEYNPNPAPVLNYLPTPNLPAEGGAVPNFGAAGQPAPVLTQSQLTRQNQMSGMQELERQRAMKKLAERGRVLDAFSNLQKIRNEEIAKADQIRMGREHHQYQKQYEAQSRVQQKQHAAQVKEYERQMKKQQRAQR